MTGKVLPGSRSVVWPDRRFAPEVERSLAHPYAWLAERGVYWDEWNRLQWLACHQEHLEVASRPQRY